MPDCASAADVAFSGQQIRSMNTTTCCPPGAADPASAPDRCPPAAQPASCCPTPAVCDDQPGYKLWPFVSGWIVSRGGRIPQVSTRLTTGDRFEHWQMRWGIGRSRYSIAPGLYAVGHPDQDSRVLVTANYKMSFDLLRRALTGRNLWLLILDTGGINVWCAAGKGTFGTDELVQRIKTTELAERVRHRHLILPQLGAVGVAAHRVKQASGFQVNYGPVRADDLPLCLDNGLQVTPAMRRVSFTVGERLALAPVELINARKQLFWGLFALLFLGGIDPSVFSMTGVWQRGGPAVLVGLAGLVGGALLVPLLLPWLPGRAFAVKGASVGLALALTGTAVCFKSLSWMNSLALLIALPAISSWFAMHFTGSSTFTSPSGVEKEMRAAIPAQAAALVVAAACWIAAAFM